MGYFLDSAEEWWDVIWNAGFRRLVGQLTPSDQERFRKEHLEEVAALATAKGIWLDVGVLFTIGTAGVFLRRNVITILLSVEIMLNAVNLNLVAFSRFIGGSVGQVFALFAVAITVAEVVEQRRQHRQQDQADRHRDHQLDQREAGSGAA